MFNPIQWAIDFLSSLTTFFFFFIVWGIYLKPKIENEVKLTLDPYLSEIKRELDPYLPAIFEKIDPYLPDKIKELNAPELRVWIRERIAEVIVLPAEKQEKAIDVVTQAYNPIANAKAIVNVSNQATDESSRIIE